MKRILFTALGIACLSTPVFAIDKAEFKETGFEKERALLANNPVFASNIKAGVVDVNKLGIDTIDVNGDGEKEILVHDYNSFSCGSQGCSTYLFHKTGTQYLSILNLISGDAIAVGDKSSKNNGFRDIYVQGGNGKPIRWSFDGKEYVLND